MKQISRRELGRIAVAGLAGASLMSADPLGIPIGCQTYPVRDALGKDFPGTLKTLASLGYKSIEMCSPLGYAKSGYGPLSNMKPSEIRKVIHDAGLTCESSHFTARELKENLDDRIAFSKELGLKQMILASFGLRKDATLSDWTKAADELNKIGEQIHKAGIQAGFHNHNGEFEKIDGVLIYDKLMQTFDPKLVKMQFQVSVISMGFAAATYFEKYPGRFISIHLQDWSSTDKKMVPVGSGIVEWKRLFGAAKKAGVKNYFVELNMDALKPSFDYLHGLKA